MIIKKIFYLLLVGLISIAPITLISCGDDEDEFEKDDDRVFGMLNVNGETFYYDECTTHSIFDVSRNGGYSHIDVFLKKGMWYEAPFIFMDIYVKENDLSNIKGKKLEITGGSVEYRATSLYYCDRAWSGIKSGNITVKDINTSNNTITLELDNIKFDKLYINKEKTPEKIVVKGTLKCNFFIW
ncbi:MAG: hypothetical protein J5918_04065 [Prevotella sp.]|nr:hypothetical protein [Prevotella sp.]